MAGLALIVAGTLALAVTRITALASSNGLLLTGLLLNSRKWINGDKTKVRVDGFETIPASELGLYDMTGNAWEICSDLYARYTGESEYNPKGPSTSEKGRVRRGGGWLNRANYSRISYRYYTPHGQRNDFLGFRLAMDCE